MSPIRVSISSISSTTGFGPASHHRVNASARAPVPKAAMMSDQTPYRNSSPTERAREASAPTMTRMAGSTASRIAWAGSTFTYTHRKSPASPLLSRSRSASKAEVLPVCRGACSTK